MSLVSWEQKAASSMWKAGADKIGAKAERVALERLPFSAENVKALQEKAAKDQLPSVVAKMGNDTLLLSSPDLVTKSRLGRSELPAIAEGSEISVDGALAQVLHTDDGFSEIDASAVTVAVLDTGMDTGHEAFKDRVVSPFNAIDGSSDVTDRVGHGTFVSGIVGGAKEGVAPSVKLMPVKVTDDSGNMNPRFVAKGIYHAVDNGAKVINMSLGGPAPKKLTAEGAAELAEFEKAVKYAQDKNVVLVSVSGNDGAKNLPYFPSDFAGILDVGAVERNGDSVRRPMYSNYGDRLDLVAPGKAQAAVPGGGMREESGTSVSAPHVAGAAALVFAKHPDWNAEQVSEHLKRAVNDIGAPGKDPSFGFGELNLFKAAYGHDLPAVPNAAPQKGLGAWLREKTGLG
ncbi:MAG TPA: S8 family serine peptidase [Stenomitos sp.]